MTDIDKMIEEAAKAFWSYGKDRESGIDDLKAALSTIAPLSDLAGVKAGTHVVVPVEPTEKLLECMAKIADGPWRGYHEYWALLLKASRPTEQSDV